MTAIAAAMKKSGIDTDATRLYALATECLRSANAAPARALSAFLDAVCDAGGLAVKLIPREGMEPFAIDYLEQVARDMRGEGMRSQDRGGGHVQRAQQGQNVVAPTKADDGCGHLAGAHQGHMFAAAPSSPASDDERVIMSAPTEARRVAPLVIATHAAPRPPAGKPRGLAEMQRVMKVTTIFESFLLRDGTPIGELRYSQLDRFIADNAREAALLRMIRNHARPADPNERIKNIVKAKDLQRFVQLAAQEAQNA